MSILLQDLRYAFRFLKQRAGITGIAILVMALGISLTTTMYAIIQGVVLSGPDYPELDRVVYLRTTIPKSQFNQSVRVHDYLDWNEQQNVFSGMAAYTGLGANLSGLDARAETLRGVRMTASTFDLLDTQPMIGRAFTSAEDHVENPDMVILGHHIWEDRFGSDPQVLGTSVRINARPMTIVGVMPPGFRFPESHDVWMPLGVDPGLIERREGPGLSVIGRLRDGVDLDEAHARLTGIATRLEQEYPEANEAIVPVTELWRDAQFVDAETKGLLYTMFVAVLGVLLIACANVANLLFAITAGRSKELAVRASMGAARVRVLRQLLTETLVLAAGGAALGIVLSKYSLDLFTRVVTPLGIPPWMAFELSPAVILFVIGITLFAALASGLIPALGATRTDLNVVLQDQSRGTSSRSVSRWSQVLLIVEVALSCALLVGAGLTVRSTLEVGKADYGINREGILTARVSLPTETYPDTTARQAVTEQLRGQLERVSGVEELALASNLPVLGTSLRFYGVRDRDYADDGEYSFSGYTSVTPSFFDVIDVDVMEGRGFNTSDALDTERVVIVDQRFVELNWPGESALGRQVRLGRSDSENPWLTVVGVVSTFEMTGPLNFGGSPPEGMFVPLAQEPTNGVAILAKTAGDPFGLTAAVRDIVTRLDPDIPLTLVDTLDERVNEASMELYIIGGMFMIFGIVALFLACIGLYAVMAFSVSRRSSEVGIRMALGATAGRILRLIIGQGVKPIAIGVAIGLLLAVFLGRALATFLYNVKPADPLTFVGIPVLLIAVSLLALLVPANRAARIAPATALREE